MANAHGWEFECDLGVDDALPLVDGTAGFAFRVRESEYQGRYLNGTDARGVRIRILGEPRLAELELYLPSPPRGQELDEPSRSALIETVVLQLLARLGARDVRED